MVKFAAVRIAFAIFAAALILLGSMSNVVLIAEFKLNQSEIERLYCVNKTKPEKHCHGKCHLAKQLVENNGRKGQSSPLSQLEDTYKINFFHLEIPSIASSLTEETNLPMLVGRAPILSRLFGKSVFQPPDNHPLV